LIGGDYFGELGFFHGTPKPMSVWCVRNTHMIYFEKKNLDILMKMVQKRQELDKIAFLKQISAFKTLTTSKLKVVIDQFSLLHKIRGSYLFKEGDLVNNIYLVFHGEFKLLKRVYKDRPSF
jgi:CRP-like cAMP-binding protein